MPGRREPTPEPLDAREFAELVRSLERPLGSFVAQMVPGAALAEDVLQETFLVAWRERARMPRGPGERRAWLYGVARNQTLHTLRKQRRGRRAHDEAQAAGLRLASAGENEALAMRDFVATILSPSDRSLFVLRYVHGFTAQSLAEMTGMRASTVRKRLERSAAALRRALEAQDPEEEGDDVASVIA